MKRDKIIFWIASGLFSLMLLGGAMMYIFDHENVIKMFEAFGFPAYIIYPMAFAKLLGVGLLLQPKSQTLRQWAYAGFMINLTLAIITHVSIGDGEAFGVIPPFALLIVSMIFNAKLNKTKA